MRPEQETLTALRDRVAALQAPPCGMAHERIPAGADGGPMASSRSPSGFARIGVCPETVRAVHIGCSHTTARYLLRDALMMLPGAEAKGLLAALHELEQAISLLDHRRYDAESRRAEAMRAAPSAVLTAAEGEIAVLLEEHRSCCTRATTLRDAVVRRLNEALAFSESAISGPAPDTDADRAL